MIDDQRAWMSPPVRHTLQPTGADAIQPPQPRNPRPSLHELQAIRKRRPSARRAAHASSAARNLIHEAFASGCAAPPQWSILR